MIFIGGCYILAFYPAGQYNPRPSTDTENALPPPATNYTITGLIPYTEYEFQVLSQNDVNKAASNWVTARTLESGECHTVAENKLSPLTFMNRPTLS